MLVSEPFTFQTKKALTGIQPEVGSFPPGIKRNGIWRNL